MHIHYLIQLAGIHPEKVEATILADPSTSPFLPQALLDLKMLPLDQAARESFLLARLAQSKLNQRPRASLRVNHRTGEARSAGMDTIGYLLQLQQQIM